MFQLISPKTEILTSLPELSGEEFHGDRIKALVLTQILAIALVLGLLVTALHLLKKKGFAQSTWKLSRAGSKAKEMSLIERLPLSAQHSLFLVQVKGTTLLIGVSPGGCQRVAAFPNFDQSNLETSKAA